MSSYLLAFAVGTFHLYMFLVSSLIFLEFLFHFFAGYYEYIETTDENGVIMRIYTPIGRTHEGLYLWVRSYGP